MWRVSRLFIAGLFAICALPALASNHKMGMDPIEHLQLHLGQANFWIGQGQWVAAFNQSVCTSELTWQTMLTHWIFTQGGGLWLMVGLLMLMLAWAWSLHRKIAEAFHKATWFLRFQKRHLA
jgi:hypothetical protein